MISVQEVSKNYGCVKALDKVSLRIPKGQVLGMLGQNGAGKTSLLNIISGYLPPSQGNILINGIDMAREPINAKAHIGYLPESPPLYPEMTVKEYLRFCCDIKRVVKADQDRHIVQIVQITGLQDVADRRISNLSKGYRQRTGLAQALCGDPDVLLLDEPSSGFDPAQAIEFRGIVQRLSGKHTIIISSHILGEIQAICDRVIILHQGQLLYDQLVNVSDREKQSIRFHLRVRMPMQALIRAVRSLPSVLSADALSEESGVSDVSINAKTEVGFEEELFTLLSGLQTPILRLTPIAESMEDIFMRITSPRFMKEPAS